MGPNRRIGSAAKANNPAFITVVAPHLVGLYELKKEYNEKSVLELVKLASKNMKVSWAEPWAFTGMGVAYWLLKRRQK
jgi:hypothetical protein